MPFAYELVDTPTGTPRRTKDKDPKLPDFTHPVHDAMAPDWRDLRVLAAGTRAVWGNASRFLMQHPKEENDTFQRRARMAAVYNGFRRVIKASTGMVMSRPVQLGDNASDSFKEAWENIDGQGNHGDVFTRRLLNDGLTIGVGGILVEWPAVTSSEQLSAADEEAMGLRPYWVHVLGENVINWRFAKVNGATILTLLVLKEVREVADDAFGVAEATYYRVFRRAVLTSSNEHGIITKTASSEVTWELWRYDVQQDKPVLETAATLFRGATRIPFSPFVNGDSPGTLESEPPLQDLADMNINHYQVSTDRAWVLHLACVPVPVRKGHKPQHNAAGDIVEQVIGPTALIDVDTEGDFFWRSPDGTAFDPTQKELEAIERRMGALGLAFLFPENKAQETAAAKRLDKTAENATLASMVRALRDCLEGAAEIHAELMREEATTLTPNTDFEERAMDPQLAKQLSDMEAQGQLTLDTLLDQLKAGKILPEDFDVDGEVEALAQKARDMAGTMLPGAKPPAARADAGAVDTSTDTGAETDSSSSDASVVPIDSRRRTPAPPTPAAPAPPAAVDHGPALESVTASLGAVTQQLQALAEQVRLLTTQEAQEPPPAPAAPAPIDLTQLVAIATAIGAAMRGQTPPAFTMKKHADGTTTIEPSEPVTQAA